MSYGVLILKKVKTKDCTVDNGETRKIIIKKGESGQRVLSMYLEATMRKGTII